MLCCTMLRYATLCYTLLYSTLLYSTLLYSTLLYYTVLCYTVLYYTMDLTIIGPPAPASRGGPGLRRPAARATQPILLLLLLIIIIITLIWVALSLAMVHVLVSLCCPRVVGEQGSTSSEGWSDWAGVCLRMNAADRDWITRFHIMISVGWRYVSNATCPLRPHLFSMALLF